jgi:serine/threonine protein kinase
MYPAADMNLEDFMDDISEDEQEDCGNKLHSTRKFFGCLSTAMSFIHNKNVKHMDIKPKNILIRRSQEGYKVYIADFGIAKAYRSAAESFTDSPTAFTRTYAAPEVVMQDTRGYPADIFSLGCVFMEMYACLAAASSLNHREQLLGVRGMEYHNHITEVITWYRSISTMLTERYRSLPACSQGGHLTSELNGIVPEMLNKTPSLRPSADSLKRITAYLGCSVCDLGPEQFEAAERQVGGL